MPATPRRPTLAMTTAVATTSLAAAGFLALHLLFERVRAPFHVRLQLSRGVASLVLVGVGFFALFSNLELWRTGFLALHSQDSPLARLVWVFAGHLVADLIWLLWGRVRESSRPRPDLILHHVMGLGAISIAAWLEAGYAILAISLTTEMMPVTTGLSAWAVLRDDRRAELRSWQLRLAVLVAWRLPLWVFEIVTISWNLLFGAAQGALLTIFWCGLVVAVAFLALDFYWIRKVRAKLRRFGPGGTPNDPSAVAPP